MEFINMNEKSEKFKSTKKQKHFPVRIQKMVINLKGHEDEEYINVCVLVRHELWYTIFAAFAAQENMKLRSPSKTD